MLLWSVITIRIKKYYIARPDPIQLWDENLIQGCPVMGKPGRYEAQAIEPMILTILGQKVILDADLARIYGVPTKKLN